MGKLGRVWVSAWDGAWVHGGVDVVVVFYKTILPTFGFINEGKELDF